MISELSLQKDVVDAVREAGGFAFKLTNRFTVGVADLLVKLPGEATRMVEVKFRKDYKNVAAIVKFKITPMQRSFLTKYRDAGGQGGLMVFANNPDNKTIYMGFRPLTYAYWESPEFLFQKHEMVALPREGWAKNEAIIQALKR